MRLGTNPSDVRAGRSEGQDGRNAGRDGVKNAPVRGTWQKLEAGVPLVQLVIEKHASVAAHQPEVASVHMKPFQPAAP